MPVINVTHFRPGTLSHIKEVLKSKHKGQKVHVLYRTGGDVVYMVGGKI